MNTQDHILNKFNLSFDDTTRMPIEIPNVGRDNLPDLFRELGFGIGAEIGVLDGEFSEKLCQGNPDLKLYSIDPWDEGGFADYKPGKVADHAKKTLGSSYIAAVERLSRYNCEIVKKTSMDAVRDFADNSLDFVYIDGDHTFKHISQDICEWAEKVRPGGIISGHDYRKTARVSKYCHVLEVVNAYVSAYHIKPLFVLGEKNAPGHERDRERSWMWVKQ